MMELRIMVPVDSTDFNDLHSSWRQMGVRISSGSMEFGIVKGSMEAGGLNRLISSDLVSFVEYKEV